MDIGAFEVQPSPNPTVTGTAGNDAYTLQVNGGNLVVTDGNGRSTKYAIATTTSLTVNGGTGDDTLTVDYTTGDFGNLTIIFDGGTGGNDTLAVIGNTATSATYTPNAATFGNGVVSVSGTGGTARVKFAGLEPVDISGMATVTIASPANATNSLTLDAGFDSATARSPPSLSAATRAWG